MRFFLDHCVSPHFAPALDSLCKGQRGSHRVIALRDRFAPDAHDEVWLPKLAEEGDWIVISGDSNIYRHKERRKIWLNSRLTSFFWQPGWHHQRFWDKAWRMVKWWPQIMVFAESSERGSSYAIPYGTGRKIKPLSL